MAIDFNLAGRVQLGEDSSLELKLPRIVGNRVRGPERAETADELAAMANGRGGTLVLGVEDRSREVIGLDEAALDVVEQWVRELCNDLIKPPVDADILKRQLENAHGEAAFVIRVDVPRSLTVHESPGGYYRRLGSSRRRLAPDMLARLFQERANTRLIRFDESLVPRSSPEDLEHSLARKFLVDEPTTENLRKLRILGEDPDGDLQLTIAGMLLCTRHPERRLPHAYIQAVSYAGDRSDVDYQTDARDICGPLDEQVAEALHFVARNMLVRATKTCARVERLQFSERAVFEALVNAVAHRDYSMLGSRIRLHMFSDRIELFVPGGLTNTLTTDSLHLRQSNRNELVVSLLARCSAPSGIGRTRLMDVRGDGVPIIREQCQELSGRLPEYRLIDESELRLVMWAGGDG